MAFFKNLFFFHKLRKINFEISALYLVLLFYFHFIFRLTHFLKLLLDLLLYFY